jgi:DNA-binding LacI/PurR family transcriptional regulator
LRARGVRVPEEIALVSIGDYPLARNPLIGLSGIPEPIVEMGAMAAQLLLDLMEGRAKPPVHRRVKTAHYIARRTM